MVIEQPVDSVFVGFVMSVVLLAVLFASLLQIVESGFVTLAALVVE